MEDPSLQIDDLAAILGGTAASPAEAEGTVVEHMYKPRESVFGAVARDMVRAGWSVFPQEMDGNRRPGTVNGEMIKWSEKYRLATQLPDEETIALWAAQCAPLNVAVVLGPASGNTFVIDIDVVEEELSAQIQEIAERVLGRTPLRRVGRYPKIALVYRHAEGDEVPGRSPKFAPFETPDNPDNVDQGIEIIGTGQAMTFYGKHHRTGRYFRWLEGPPHMLGPENAPLVTSQQVNEFLDLVDSVRQFHKSASFEPTAVTWEWNETEKVHVPRVRPSGAATDWIEDENGRVVDGREAYLTRLAYRIVRANAGMALDERPGGGRDRLVQIAVDQFSETAETTGRWKGQSLWREARSKVVRAAEKMKSGQITPFAPARDERGEYIASADMRSYVPPQPRGPGVDSLDFLPPFADPSAPGFRPDRAGRRRPLRCEVSPPEAGAAEARAIEPDRTRVAQGVQEGLSRAFGEFWDEVYDPERTESRVHILKAPTGAGKTSRGIAYIAEDPRTKQDYVIRGRDGQVLYEGRAPILFLLPTYANIEELRMRAQALNLDGSLPDEELREQARERGLIHEDDLPAKLAELRRDARKAGLETMIYQGKIRAGCAMAEKVKLAMEAGIGTGSLCKAEVPTGQKDEEGKPVMETRYCEHYFNYKGTGTMCPAIAQKEQIARSHVVFMPHAFLALQIPEELKHVRAVVADERIHHLFLHTTTLDLNVFAAPRKPPRLTKREREAGVRAEEFMPLRQQAASVVNEALITGRCPAEALARVEGVDADGTPLPVAWIDAALRSCGASMQKDGDITPDISLEDLMEICAQPTGQQVREEHRFWTVVKERVLARREEIKNEELAKDFPHLAVPRKTKGDRDYRIQLVEDMRDDGEPIHRIRISWRVTPNWSDRPLLLLDASAAPEMIEKIWGKKAVVHDIPAALNVRTVCIADRTYSNASVVAPPSATPKEKLDSARTLASVRKAVATISAMYGWSRVVAGGSILVRRTVNTDWEGPHNVDWCHYGAMRGLDFAKHHAAAISVGRMELPIRTIDGLVAALTYDDDEPEAPYDRRGNGLGRDNQPLRIPMGMQRIRMRSGHDVSMPVPMFPGKWGRMIQRQYREEELLQFLGRLRPVYREGEAPVWFSLSSVIPEEVIVDDLVNLEDLLGSDWVVWEAVRRCGGILVPRIAAMTCDDLFPSEEKAAAAMRAAGLDPETGKASERASWAFACWKWKADDGSEGHAFVMAGKEDQEKALRNVFARYLDRKLLMLEQESPGRERTLARGRLPDRIEDELGTLEDRRLAEERRSVEAAMEVLMTTPPEALRHLLVDRRDRGPVLPVSVQVPPAAEGEPPPQPFGLDVAEAQATIRDMWKEKGYGSPSVPVPATAAVDLGYEAAVSQVQGLGEDVSYEGAGAHVGDGEREFDVMDFDEQDEKIPW